MRLSDLPGEFQSYHIILLIEGIADARIEISTVGSSMLSHIAVALRYSVDGVRNAGWLGQAATLPMTPPLSPQSQMHYRYA